MIKRNSKGATIIYTCKSCKYILYKVNFTGFNDMILRSDDEVLKAFNYQCPKCKHIFTGIKIYNISYR